MKITIASEIATSNATFRFDDLTSCSETPWTGRHAEDIYRKPINPPKVTNGHQCHRKKAAIKAQKPTAWMTKLITK
jgi:hypothetical protein